MTRFQVETDEVDSVVSALASMSALCDEVLSAVDSLAAAASVGWSGEANAQFLALKAEWADGARQMAEGIRVIHTATSVSNTNYLASAAAAARVW
ncbi:MAG: WXG100 family type VII secretion target [Lacisediminihabitans sp.]